MKHSAIFVFALLLTACGGGASDPNTNPDPNNPPNTTTYKKVGYVSLTESSSPLSPQRSAFGLFQELETATPVPDTGAFFPTDTCLVTVIDTSQPQPTPTPTPTPIPPSPTPLYLDAGDPLTLSSGGATFTTLPKTVTNGNIFYSATDLAAFPPSLTLTIPGAANGFPEFKDVTLPPSPADFTFTVSGDDTNAVTKDTVFSWTGQSSGQFFFAGSAQLSSTKNVSFVCYPKDDSSFTFPDKAKADLAAAGFTSGGLTVASRQAYSSQVKGDALLIVSTGTVKLLFDIPVP